MTASTPSNLPFVPDHGNPSASARDDQHALLDQISNDFQFNNVNRIGRWHHAAITAGCILHDLPSKKALAFLGIGARIERADGFAGVLHRGIVGRDQALGENRRNRHVQTGLLQFGLQGLLEKISDLTLSRGATNVQRMTGDLACPPLRAQQRCSNLRTVAMREHEPVAGTDQADDLGRCPLGVCALLGDGSLFSRANQGVSANGKEHGLHKQCFEQARLQPGPYESPSAAEAAINCGTYGAAEAAPLQDNIKTRASRATGSLQSKPARRPPPFTRASTRAVDELRQA